MTKVFPPSLPHSLPPGPLCPGRSSVQGERGWTGQTECLAQYQEVPNLPSFGANLSYPALRSTWLFWALATRRCWGSTWRWCRKGSTTSRRRPTGISLVCTGRLGSIVSRRRPTYRFSRYRWYRMDSNTFTRRPAVEVQMAFFRHHNRYIKINECSKMIGWINEHTWKELVESFIIFDNSFWNKKVQLPQNYLPAHSKNL